MKKILLFLTVSLLSTTLFADAITDKKVDNGEKTLTRLESLTKLTKVIGTIEKFYVDDIKLQEIVNKALKGLMTELDAHSTYMDPKYYKEMKIQTKGEFGGLGIVVGMRDGALTVISPIDDTPAYDAGVKAGDIILKINDKSTLNMTLDEAVGIMRGKPKSTISITVVREGERKPIKIDIVRDIIKIQSVYSKTIDEKYLYLRVSSFDEKVAEGLKEAIEKANPDIKGIILDLRNNPGGLLNQAIDTVDLFVDEGVIVSQKGRTVQYNESFEASSVTTITDLPMVVLVNGGSASASEIVSGALQDLGRAVIVGEKSFGKGSVQVLIPITEDGIEGIKLTIAKYYLPSGRTIQATGITPDIISYPGKAVSEPDNDLQIKEADLKKHLESELEKIANKKEKQKEAKKDENVLESKKKVITKEELQNDNQLKTAVDILTALIITKQ